MEQVIEKAVNDTTAGVTITKGDGEIVLQGETILSVLYALGVFKKSAKGETVVQSGISPSLIKQDCCKVAYARGLFLGCGSVTLSGGYHMEFLLSHEDMAKDLSKLFSHFGIESKILSRHERYMLYLKDSEAVSDCLALLGASSAVIKLNDEYVNRQVRQEANRRNNCDIANIQKTVNASVRIIENVRYIEKKVGLATLDEKLRVVAKGRLDYPEDSFSALADKLGLSKSTVKNRFNKLDEIANKLRKGDI
jgi:DNA-binding protein WhiA